MPWSQEQKERSLEKILNSAILLFSNRGFDSVAISEIMQHAGMSHGGFYAHFSSKSELYREAIIAAASRSGVAKLPKGAVTKEQWLSRLVAGYLDPAHVRQEQPPCPLAFLVTDVAHQDEDVRAAYTIVYKKMVNLISRQLPASDKSRRETVLALTAMMIGGVAISRALDDETTMEALLAACQKLSQSLLVTDAADDNQSSHLFS